METKTVSFGGDLQWKNMHNRWFLSVQKTKYERVPRGLPVAIPIHLLLECYKSINERLIRTGADYIRLVKKA